MLEKWERQPMRVGMVVGFVVLPLLWALQEYLLHLALGFRSPSSDLIPRYFIVGAIPGAILGAGVSKAVFAGRQGNWGAAKSHLLRYGGVVFTLFLLLHAHFIWELSRSPVPNVLLFGSPVPPWFGLGVVSLFNNLPFQCAFLMFFIGLLMRARR